MAEALTIDELARATGMTVRNIRSHATRGLLPPPEVRARTGYYGPDHVARLELILELQAAGHNLAGIKHLSDALDRLRPLATEAVVALFHQRMSHRTDKAFSRALEKQ